MLFLAFSLLLLLLLYLSFFVLVSCALFLKVDAVRHAQGSEYTGGVQGG